MDKVEICNIALNHIGVATIERFDEASEPARVCRRCYDYVRQAVLRKFPWTFATRSVQLAALQDVPPNWKYAYRYPADAVCLRMMYNEHFCGLPRDNQYKIVSDKQGKAIYTNIGNAWIEYTVDVTDADLYDAQFVEAFGWKLAAEIAYALTGKLDLTQMCIQAYNAYFAEASSTDADEEHLLDSHIDRLAAARFTGA